MDEAQSRPGLGLRFSCSGGVSMTVSLGYVGAYVVLVDVASFIESPVGRGLGAFQLTVLIRTGSLLAALEALVLTHGFAIPEGPPALARHRPDHWRGITLLLLRARLPLCRNGRHLLEPLHRDHSAARNRRPR